MKLIKRNAIAVACVISAFGLANCVSSSGSGNGSNSDTGQSDSSQPVDVATPVEDVVSVDTSSPADAGVVADVPPSVQDVPPVEDVAAQVDVTPAEDVAVVEDTTPAPEDVAPPVPDGLCTSPEDQAIVDSQNDDFDIEQISKDCVIANILGDPDGAKAKKCIQDATDLSDGCTECFGEVALCGKDKCLGSCALNPDGQGCTDCVAENCLPAFEECSGLSTAKE